MKIKSVLSSRLRSPAKSEPDMMSKTRLHVPATGGELDSRTAAETTNESDESRTTAATANESIEMDLKAAVDASIKPSEPDESQTAAATASEPDVFAVFSSVISEAKSIGDDLSRLIVEDVGVIVEEVGDMKAETESVIKRTAKVISVEFEDWRLKRAASAEWSVSTEQNMVKGHSHWAKEIKKLAKSERKKEKTEEQIMKFDEQIANYENIISTLEEEQVETRKTIKALHQKAMLSGGSNQDEENGAMKDWATAVKRLGQLERKKKKAEKQLATADKQMTKYEKCLSVTEQKHQETMKNIKFLSYYHCDDDSVMSWESRV